jgi:hypothetical protein
MGRYRRTYRQSACAHETTEPPVAATAPDPLGWLAGRDTSGFAFTHCRLTAQWVATTGVWLPPRARQADIKVYAAARGQANAASTTVCAGTWNARWAASTRRQAEGILSRVRSIHARNAPKMGPQCTVWTQCCAKIESLAALGFTTKKA